MRSSASDGPGYVGRYRARSTMVAAALGSLIAVAMIVALIARADATGAAELRLSDLGSEVAVLQNAPWRLVSDTARSDQAVLSELRASEGRVMLGLARLERGDAPSSIVPLRRLLQEDFAVLSRQASLLTQSRLAAARSLERSRFRLQDRIDRVLHRANTAYHQEADQWARYAAIGSTVIAVMLLCGFIVFYRRAFLARRAAELLSGDLAESEQHLEEAQRLAAVGSWEFDLVDGTFVCSAENARLHGCGPGPLPTSPETLLAKLAPADRDLVLGALRASSESGGEVCLDYRVERTGEQRLIHLSAKVVRSEEGHARLMGTCQDVTDRLRRIEAERAHQVKSEFMSHISHELRTPLNAILGFAQLLSSSGLPERDARNAGRIVDAGQQLLGLVDGILNASRGPSEPPPDRPELAGGEVDAHLTSLRDPADQEQGAGEPLVLCVDGSADNLTLVEHVFSLRPGVELVTARTAELGLEIAREREPAVVLLDLELSEDDGGQMLTALKADPRTSRVPVVLLGGTAEPASAEALLAAGGHAYVCKPLDVTELLDAIDQILLHSGSLRG